MNEDTIKLLRECSSGVKMGIDSIEEVMPNVSDKALLETLNACKDDHVKLGSYVDGMLAASGEESKEPNPMAKGMSWMKTNLKVAVKPGDNTVAGLITDGCNMGIKSLNRYLNEFAAADDDAKGATRDLIKIEESCVENLKSFL